MYTPLESNKPQQTLFSIKDIVSEFKTQPESDKKQKELKEFQIWALEFAEKYGCKKEIPILMRFAKKLESNLDYLRHVDGWISDYPNRKGNVIPLFLWKLKQDGFIKTKSKNVSQK